MSNCRFPMVLSLRRDSLAREGELQAEFYTRSEQRLGVDAGVPLVGLSIGGTRMTEEEQTGSLPAHRCRLPATRIPCAGTLSFIPARQSAPGKRWLMSSSNPVLSLLSAVFIPILKLVPLS